MDEDLPEEDQTQNDDGTWLRLKHIKPNTLDECKRLCYESAEHCFGVEYYKRTDEMEIEKLEIYDGDKEKAAGMTQMSSAHPLNVGILGGVLAPNLAAQGRAISMGSTSMSSQYAGSAAVNAIESDWKRTGLLAHTSGGAGETSPWWQVELTQSFQIGTVLILNDVGECGSRFLKGWQCNGTLDGESFFGPGEGAVVGVSDRPCVGDICSGTACGSIHIPSLTDWYSIDCGGAMGKFVYVQLPGPNRVLAFSQLLAYAFQGNARFCPK
eukprot:gene28851-biopygen29991